MFNHPPPSKPIPAPARLTPPKSWPRSTSLQALKLLPELGWADGFSKVWAPGEQGAHKRLRRTVHIANDYARTRDVPSIEGTSRLSPHLHFGEISPRAVWYAVTDPTYRREIAWRDFANHVLFHFPHTITQPLRPEFANFPWKKSSALKAWQKGKTGYPLVDAGLRELWTTGWMHNRVRMIVGSFLVKDLGVSWTEGAAWFWDTLVDADLANNTFNWQWVGGCGADAAPYFRIFNPNTQAEKFDPDQIYIKRWVPELKAGESYIPPVVDHAEARQNALQIYSQWRKKGRLA